MPLIEEIASDTVIDAAFDWVYTRRKEYSSHSDIWDLRKNWPAVKPFLQAADYRPQPLETEKSGWHGKPDTDEAESGKAPG